MGVEWNDGECSDGSCSAATQIEEWDVDGLIDDKGEHRLNNTTGYIYRIALMSERYRGAEFYIHLLIKGVPFTNKLGFLISPPIRHLTCRLRGQPFTET